MPADQDSLNIKQSHSPSTSPARAFDTNLQATSSNANSLGLGLALDSSSQAFTTAAASATTAATAQPDLASLPDYTAGGSASYLAPSQPDLSFDPTLSYADQTIDPNGAAAYSQGFINPQQAFSQQEDFALFPPPQQESLSATLFEQHQQHNMAASQAHHSPTPPHMLNIESHPGSAHQSPSFNQHQFVQPMAQPVGQPMGRHSRNTSLAPEAALLNDWNAPHFQGHRRTASEFSDASSIGGHSPSLGGQDTFDGMAHVNSSPMIRPDESADVYQELHGINSFSISNGYVGHSPAHSPSISPRILPQTIPEANPNNFMLQGPGDGSYSSYLNAPQEAFPQLPISSDLAHGMPQMSAPTIEIDYAPSTSVPRNMFEGKPMMDTDALTPPDQRGRPRRRAITDPYSGGAAGGGRPAPGTVGSLSPNPGADLGGRGDPSRSLSPMERSGSAVAGNRRRLSTSAVPNNLMALRLADPDFADRKSVV